MCRKLNKPPIIFCLFIFKYNAGIRIVINRLWVLLKDYSYVPILHWPPSKPYTLDYNYFFIVYYFSNSKQNAHPDKPSLRTSNFS